MPNLYVTPDEIKMAAPDMIQAATTKYDDLLYRLAGGVSRSIEKKCFRTFYPFLETRYFWGSGEEVQWISDLIEVTTIEYSQDEGYSYTALTISDYIPIRSGNYNHPGSYNMLVINRNGQSTLGCWPAGQKAVKITGWWAYTEDRASIWESTGVILAAAYTSGGASLEIANAAVEDKWGLITAFHKGKILKVESEVFECLLATVVPATNDTITVVGARNGSSAATHAKDTAITLFQAPDEIKEAAIIQAVRMLERGLQGFGDARATAEIGQLLYVRRWDPEALDKIGPFINYSEVN